MRWTLCHRDQITLAVFAVLFYVTVLSLSLFKTEIGSERKQHYRFQVDVNTATVVELQTLPGIGEKLAEAIVFYRKERRSFNVSEEIMNVRGIGVKKFEAIKPYLLEIQAK